MSKIVAALLLSVSLAGCVSNADVVAAVAQAEANCERTTTTWLARARCKNRILLAVDHGRDRDLYELAAARREAIAAKMDRHEMSEEDGRLALAETVTQITNETRRRNIEGRPQPVVVVNGSRPCGAVVQERYYNTAC